MPSFLDDDAHGQGAVEADAGEEDPDQQVVRLSFPFVTASEKLEMVLSPSTPGPAARVSREIIEDRRRSSMMAHSALCASAGGRADVGMGRDELVVFSGDVCRMATSKLAAEGRGGQSGQIWVNPAAIPQPRSPTSTELARDDARAVG